MQLQRGSDRRAISSCDDTLSSCWLRIKLPFPYSTDGVIFGQMPGDCDPRHTWPPHGIEGQARAITLDADFGKSREDTHLQATGSSMHRNYILQHGPVRAFERTYCLSNPSPKSFIVQCTDRKGIRSMFTARHDSRTHGSIFAHSIRACKRCGPAASEQKKHRVDRIRERFPKPVLTKSLKINA